MSSDRAGHLTAQQFHDHLRKVYESFGSDADGATGHHFWRSCETYGAHEATDQGWAFPRQGSLLQVDLEISRLLKRDVPPMIEYKSRHYPFRRSGPYALVRLRMARYLDALEDPSAQEEHQVETIERVDLVEEMISMLQVLTSIQYSNFAPRASGRGLARHARKSPLYDVSRSDEVIREALARCEDAANSLIELHHILQSEMSANECRRVEVGRRDVTKSNFVGMAADLWRDLTGAPASRGDTSLFSGFVTAIWYSYDEGAPEVSFARALRNRP